MYSQRRWLVLVESRIEESHTRFNRTCDKPAILLAKEHRTEIHSHTHEYVYPLYSKVHFNPITCFDPHIYNLLVSPRNGTEHSRNELNTSEFNNEIMTYFHRYRFLYDMPYLTIRFFIYFTFYSLYIFPPYEVRVCVCVCAEQITGFGLATLIDS